MIFKNNPFFYACLKPLLIFICKGCLFFFKAGQKHLSISNHPSFHPISTIAHVVKVSRLNVHISPYYGNYIHVIIHLHSVHHRPRGIKIWFINLIHCKSLSYSILSHSSPFLPSNQRYFSPSLGWIYLLCHHVAYLHKKKIIQSIVARQLMRLVVKWMTQRLQKKRKKKKA